MKTELPLVADLHTHTLASGHAYSTVQEMILTAREKGLEVLALTEHGPAMPGSCHLYYFGNMRVIPRQWNGVFVLRGVEANIIDYQGNVDLKPRYLKKLDIVWAGLHAPCLEPGTVEENTAALTGALCNPFVCGITHPGNPKFPVDEEKIAEVAAREGKMLEINNSSFLVREGSFDRCLQIAHFCRRYKTIVCVNSDAHIARDVGNFQQAWQIVQQAQIPEDQVLNTSMEKVLSFFNIIDDWIN